MAHTILSSALLVSITSKAIADEVEHACVLAEYENADENTTLKQIRERCAQQAVSDIVESETTRRTVGVISSRIQKERQTEFSPYVISPHKINYILPAYTSNAINKEAYSTFNGYEENLENIESKFQLSFKVPLNYESMFIEGDGLYFGFTLEAYWQIYADNISKPFRETNYQPELFYLAPLEWHPFGGNTGIMLGIEHQSNGRPQNLSRSWNRVYANFLFEKNNFALSFRPWVRLSEDEKEFDFAPEGDDNPDIIDFMGHYELGMVYKWNNYEFSMGGRNNFATHKGFIEAGMTFPLWGKLRAYITANSGYGDSLIDYNYKQTRFGIGVALNDIL